jgi:hypothetical protein
MTPENKIRDEIILELQAIQYIVDNSIQVKSYRDNSFQGDEIFVSVAVETATEQFPNSGLFKTEVHIACISHIDDDENQSRLKALHDVIINYLYSLDLSVVATGSGVDIFTRSKLPLPQMRNNEHPWQNIVERFNIDYAFTASAPVTTTTTTTTTTTGA